MRVIVAPSDVAPVEFAHPALFPPKSGAGAVAAARAAEADEAASKADQAKLAAVSASREAARAMMPVRVAENLKLRAEAQLAAAERAVASAGSTAAKEQAEETKAKAAARVAELETQLAAAKAELQPKLDAVAPAREAAVAAETARVVAAEAARKVARDLAPVSVFISRKTQRLYVRQAFQPILESPVTIRDADRPIGTHVFTAMERTGSDDMRWSVVSLDGGRPDGGVVEPNGPRADAAVETQSWSRPTQVVRKPRSTGSPFHRKHWIVSKGWLPAIFPDHFRRGVELGDRQGNGFCGPHERRAARRYQDATPRSGHRIPLRALLGSPALLAIPVRGSVSHLVTGLAIRPSHRRLGCLNSLG